MHKLIKLSQRSLIAAVVVLQVAFYPAITLADTTTATPDPSASSQASGSSAAPTSTGSSTSTNSAATQPTTTQPASTTSPTPTTNTPASDNSSGSSSPTPSSTTTATTTPSPTTQTGPSQPTGADAKTYHQNPDGTWSNAYYTWNPVTNQTSPNTPQSYSYNPATGMWDTTVYRYDAPSGTYVPNIVSASNNPTASSATSNAPVVSTPSPGSPNAPAVAGISNTGPNSNNTVSANNNNNGIYNGFYNAQISNTINSSATSGDASVLQNTLGGSASTGGVNDQVNLLNMLQSSWNPANGPINTFVANVGNYNGNLILDPTMINTGPNSNNLISGNSNNNLKVTVQANGVINNKVNLAAQSGNAAVSGNTTGGNATSGAANAVGNVVNLLDSTVNAGHSFIGVININGQLNGNILLPQWLLAGLVSATGPNSSNVINANVNNNLNVALSNNQNINNTIKTTAASGNALVADNTTGGTATTGKASTNVTLLNLTGKDVIGKDALLVFVNVLGKWVGLIVNQPSGSSTAALGLTGPNSNNAINSNTNNNATVNASSNQQINNDIAVAANSGNASVTDNTKGGNATSGEAHAGVNVANLIGSQLNLSDWFGVLFINVFGGWNGSFGANTPLNSPTGSPLASNNLTTPGASSTASGGQAVVFQIVPTGDNKFTVAPISGSGGSTYPSGSTPVFTSSAVSSKKSAVLGSSHQNPSTPHFQKPSYNWSLPFIGLLSGAALLGLERALAFRQRNLA